MTKDYLTTFEASRLMSVSPGAVLKWIKSGVLEARRTPGGHHRIARRSIDELLVNGQKICQTEQNQQEFQYCWEFNSRFENCLDDCENCVVFNTLAKHCYKMFNLPEEFGHLKLYCKITCEECNYYKMIQSDN
jgi:excisionase family DNA binding protein